jgi:hypothetical protein
MVLQESKPRLLGGADDIDKVLAEAFIKSTDEYRNGYEDGRNEAVDAIVKTVRKQADTFFRETVEPAEVFYTILLKIISPKNIKQYRIGLDYTTATPTVLVVISHECEGRLYDIERAAAEFDVFMFQQFRRLCSFWVVTDDSLDQDLIDRDFPWSRRGL